MKKLWLLMFSLVLGIVVAGAGCSVPAEVKSGPLPSIPGLVGAESDGKQMGIICSQQNVGLWVNGEGSATAVPPEPFVTH